jgi:nucleotide-binding universal stress UspA family protein
MKILFAIDGSDCSKEVIETGLKLNCAPGTELKVAAVSQVIETLAVLPGLKEKELEAVTRLVDDVQADLAAAHPEATVTGAVLDGFAVEEILDLSESWKADLIVLGTHGRKGLSNFLLGSVARAVLLHARCAVRIVRTGAKERKGFANVILALDDSEHSKHLIEHVIALPWQDNVQFHCVHVVREAESDLILDPDAWFGSPLTQQRESAVSLHQNWVESAAKKINTALGPEKAHAEVLIGDARSQLIELARRWPADLIMLGSHGRNAIQKLILGSVSESVASHAPCSVEIARVPAFRQAKMHIIV